MARSSASAPRPTSRPQTIAASSRCCRCINRSTPAQAIRWVGAWLRHRPGGKRAELAAAPGRVCGDWMAAAINARWKAVSSFLIRESGVTQALDEAGYAIVRGFLAADELAELAAWPAVPPRRLCPSCWSPLRRDLKRKRSLDSICRSRTSAVSCDPATACAPCQPAPRSTTGTARVQYRRWNDSPEGFLLTCFTTNTMMELYPRLAPCAHRMVLIK